MRYFDIEFISDGEVVYKKIHEHYNHKRMAIREAMDVCNEHYFNLEDNTFEMKVTEIPKELV